MRFYRIFFTFIILFLFFNNIVFADDENEKILSNINSIINVYSNISQEPSINSRAAIIYDRSSHSILFGKNEYDKRKMASTTKIMTALIVIENSNLDDIVTISSKSAGTGGSRLGLKTNDKISVQDLLYGLMLCSGNDAAVALAEHVGNDLPGFATLMNKKCEFLELQSTHFVTPHGLDNDDHYTTAHELAIITDYALKNETFSKIVKTINFTVYINSQPKNLSNTNELLGNLDGVYGVKTGFTNGANRCLVTSIKRDNMDLICIVLGADTKKDRTKDSVQLIEYAFKNFKMVNIREKITTEFDNWKLCNSSTFSIKKGVTNDLNVFLADLPYDFLPISCNYINDISIYIYCNTTFNAPLSSNNAIGYLTVSVHDKNILSLDIYNSNEIRQKDYSDFFYELIKKYISHLESLLYKNVY